MNRVATIPLQRTLNDAMQRAQRNLATTQLQLSTGTKAPDFASLGTAATRNISAHTLLSQQDTHAAMATRLGTTLSFYDSSISQIDSVGSELRDQLMTVIGTGSAAGFQETIESAFQSFRTALNANEAGSPLFGGSQADPTPFKPATLAATAGLDPAQAFGNGDVLASARLGDHVDMTYGVTASSVGTDMLAVFRTLAESGTIGSKPTDAQLTALKDAVAKLDVALPAVRAINAANGRKQVAVESLATRAKDRSLLLTEVIGRTEDADLGQVAADIAQQKTILQASYSVFSQLSELSLTSYLR